MRPETFMHVPVGGGRVTFCLLSKEVGDSLSVKVGFSFCSPRDSFTKSVGRNKARGRIFQAETPYRFMLTLNKQDRVKDTVWAEFMLRCADGRLSSGVVPSWVRKAQRHGELF